MTFEIRPLQLVADVERHGVTRSAREIAEACGCEVTLDARREPGRPLHLHFTERLWGSDPESATAWVTELARRHPTSVTLHDLPQPSDGPDSQRRRAAAYARVLGAARAVVCNSHWEAQLLAAFAEPSPPPQVIPLGVRALSAPPPAVLPASDRPVIGVLGHVYPGKGHREAIDAASAGSAALGTPIDVVALGAVSEGHAAHAAALARRARRHGVAFSVTGHLSETQLTRLARHVDVALAAHRHVSASGSIGSWLTAGRRPLVADSVYAREIDGLRPGTIQRYAPADLAETVIATLEDPHSSWLPADADLRPGPAETAAAYLRWWTQDVPW